mgnify:CR=1 FL=1
MQTESRTARKGGVAAHDAPPHQGQSFKPRSGGSACDTADKMGLRVRGNALIVGPADIASAPIRKIVLANAR